MQATEWAVLPDRVREVLAWADASEPSARVGSRGLLIGVMLAHGRNNEADQLLRHFAVSRRELFERLQAVREVKIDPDVREPSRLTALPELTPNANDVMEKARGLAPGGKPDVKHVFGGILQTSQSRAYQALASTLEPARFSEVVATYTDYLRGADRRYLAFLQEQFPRVGNVGGAAADRGTEDQLGFTLYVEAFADLIESPNTVLPLTIGIYGVWGTGKSFLLNAIGKRLEERSKLRLQDERDRKGTNHGHAPPREVPSNVHVVTFNAWEYSANEVIWPGLVRRIMSSLEERQRFYVRAWWRLRRNLGRQMRVERGRIIGGGAVLLAAAVFALLQSRFASEVLLASIAALGVGGLAKVAFDALGDPLGQWFGALFEDRRYGAPIGYMEEIKRDLGGLQKQQRLGGRVLVIVDDLDRCEPDKAVEVLQAINLLLGFKTFIVCLGIDARVVTQAIDRHYKNLLADAGASGYEYLDKIVQIPFRIPVPTTDDIKGFLKKQLPRPSTDPPHPLPPGGAGGGPGSTGGGSGSGGEKLPDPSDGVPAFVARFTDPELDAFTRLTPFLRRNPRHLKRLVNVYSLVRSLAKATHAICAENPAATVRWLAIAAQWPYTANRMLRRFSEIDDSRPKPFDGPDELAAGTDPLLYLYRAVAPSLSKKQQTKYDGDTAQLDALLKSGEDQLLWTDLRDLRYFTVNFNPAVEQDLDDDETPARAEVKRGADAEEESDNGDRELRATTGPDGVVETPSQLVAVFGTKDEIL